MVWKACMVLLSTVRLLPATAACFYLFLMQQAHADVLAKWNFQDVVSASSVAGNLTAWDMTISSGAIGYQAGTDDGGTRIGNSSSWSTNAFATPGKYIQFSITPASGYDVQVTNVTIRLGRTALGPVWFTAQYSLDGFATAGTSAGTGTLSSESTSALDRFTLSVPANTQSGTVTYRVWGHDASGTGNMRFNNFRIHGSVNSQAPPPPAPLVQAGTNIGGDRFDANWSAVPGAGGYRLDVSITGDFSSYQTGYENRDVGNATTHAVTGLLARTTYYYRVRAYDAGSTSANSATQQVITVLKAEPSNHATGFGTASTTHRTVVLEWTDAGGIDLPDGYLVRGSKTGFGDIPDPIDGINVANHTDWSGEGYANKIAQGAGVDTLTRLAAGQTYYFKLFPYANQFSQINYKSDGSVPQVLVTTISAPFEDMEDFEKPGYEAADVVLKSGTWRFDGAMQGIALGDKRHDQRSARIGKEGSITTLFDVTNVETLLLDQAYFGDHTNGRFIVQRSIDGGSSWQQVGDEVVCGATLQTVQFTVHRLVAFRLRIRNTAVADEKNVINIDNIRFTPFDHGGSVFRFR